MSTPPLTTPPSRIAIGKDSWHAREKLVDAVGNLNIAVRALESLVTQIATLVGQVNTLNTSVTGIQTTITGNLSFGDLSHGQPQGNLKTILLQGTSPATPNTAFTLTHNLGKIPNGFVVVQQNVAAIFYGTAAGNAWTTTQLTILANAASVNYTILVL